MSDLGDILQQKTMNIPGILTIEKIDYEQVNLPNLRIGQTVDIDAYLYDSLEEIDFIPGTAGIRITQQQTDQGILYLVEIPFTIAPYDAEVIDTVDEITRKPHVFVLTDKNENQYLVGFNYDPKANFRWEAKSDPDGTGGRSLACTITWRTHTWPVYIGTETGGGIPD